LLRVAGARTHATSEEEPSIMSDLEVQTLVKRFGANVIVDRVSFHVKPGEFFVLLGPSGGGKTTILRLISGLEQPDRGRIVIGRNDITMLTPRQRNLGMVFQDYGLYPTMDVYGNIAYGLEVHGIGRAEIARRVRFAADMLGLASFIHSNPSILSGGEQQRVALARVLVKDADAYLYDEPLSNLDPKLRYQARRDIIEIHRNKQRPSIYVTHDQGEAFAMADRIGVIANGHIQQIGTPDELLKTPANTFVAGFFGTPPMNLLPAELEYSDGIFMAHIAHNNELLLPLPSIWNRYLKRNEQREVILGLRPEAIIPQWQFEQQETLPQAVIKAEVVDCISLVSEVTMTLKLGDNIHITSLFQESDDPQLGNNYKKLSLRMPKKGEVIQVGIYGDNVRLFNPTTQNLINPLPFGP